MSIMDTVDEIIGRLDLIDIIAAPLILRSLNIVQIHIPRCDKSPQTASLNEAIEHLKAHGVDAAPGPFDSREMSLYVRRSQEQWTRWLLRSESDADSHTGQRVTLRRTRSRWSEQRAAQRERRNR